MTLLVSAQTACWPRIRTVATTKDRALSRQLSTLFNIGAIRELTDGQLLERFARGGEPAELAFAALVERHGAMVMRVCRAHLADPHDTQDAFQATFLLLVEKARGLWVRDSLGPWLHQVALRTASCARSSAIRRKRLEGRVAEIAATRHSHEYPVTPELARVLHEEIERLPERYRVPIVLCDLEGRTCEEAARVMGRPVGTIKCWRSRGRERLRHRLIRAGVAPSVAAGAATVSQIARAAVPEPVAEQAVRAAVRILSDGMTAGTVPASVFLIVKGVMNSMLMRQIRTTAWVTCAMLLLGTGLAGAVRAVGDDPNRPADAPPAASPRPTPRSRPDAPAAGPDRPADATWPMSLREATRIALDNNTHFVQVISRGADGQPAARSDPKATATAASPIVVAPPSRAADVQRFRSELMAVVRSVEQQYWCLVAAHVNLWAADRAVAKAQEILDREQAELKTGRGTIADVAEIQQRLEQFNLDLVTRTSDVITTERQLRNILGLPAADNRRIIPVTPGTEARLDPKWDESLAAMLKNQPEIVQARAMAATADGPSSDLDRVVGMFLPSLAGEARLLPSSDSRPTTGRAGKEAFLEQVKRDKTHYLARMFLNIDANYKQWQTASRLRAAAAQRLDAQRAYYEEGRITVDRFLDAVSQYTTAVATEAQYKATYNTTIVGLEEAKGTLLDRARIVVADAPGGTTGPPISPSDGAVMPASHETTAMPPPPTPLPPDPLEAVGPSPATPEVAKSDAVSKYSFQLTIGAGPRPFEIRGSFTVEPARAQDTAATKSP
jgi:RNA polymerase sigma factor (sigma-70 family)